MKITSKRKEEIQPEMIQSSGQPIYPFDAIPKSVQNELDDPKALAEQKTTPLSNLYQTKENQIQSEALKRYQQKSDANIRHVPSTGIPPIFYKPPPTSDIAVLTPIRKLRGY